MRKTLEWILVVEFITALFMILDWEIKYIVLIVMGTGAFAFFKWILRKY